MTPWHPPALSLADCCNALSAGVVITDNTRDEVVYCNPSFESLLGEGWSVTPTNEPLRFNSLITLTKSQKQAEQLGNNSLDGIITLSSSQPEPLKVKVTPNPLPNNMTLYWVTPYTDEQAISRAHSDFVSVVSHEFRTPLTSIKGFADTMLRYGGQLPPDQQTRFITIIKDQADRLTRMVENLLTASKLGVDKSENAYRANDLRKMIDKVVENILAKGSQDQTYADRSVNVAIPSTLPEVWADQDKLEQVLTNLIDNAVKYSFPNSEVQVKALLLADEANKITITITNLGIGIPADHLPRIFSKFSRVDNHLTRQVEGTGLGLYITKTMVTSMGGQISVESTPNEETTFTVVLKAATAELQERYHEELLAKEGPLTHLDDTEDHQETGA